MKDDLSEQFFKIKKIQVMISRWKKGKGMINRNYFAFYIAFCNMYHALRIYIILQHPTWAFGWWEHIKVQFVFFNSEIWQQLTHMIMIYVRIRIIFLSHMIVLYATVFSVSFILNYPTVIILKRKYLTRQFNSILKQTFQWYMYTIYYILNHDLV